MYYTESIINGVLCCKTTPEGEWRELSSVAITSRYSEMQEENERLKRNNDRMRSVLEFLLYNYETDVTDLSVYEVNEIREAIKGE